MFLNIIIFNFIFNNVYFYYFSTRKLGCPGSLRFKLSTNGQYYSVVDVVKHVGHEEFKVN